MRGKTDRAKSKREIHRDLVEARRAMHLGDENKAREILRRSMSKAVPWLLQDYYRRVAEDKLWDELHHLEKMLLPDNELFISGDAPSPLPLIELVPAGPGDNRFLAQVCRSVAYLYDEFLPGAFERQAAKFEREGLPGDYQTWIMEYNSEPTGFLGYKYLDSPGVVYLTAWYIHRKYQGKGIGTRAMETFQGKMFNQGINRIFLLVHWKADWALAFYQKLGYKILAKEEAKIKRFSGGIINEEYLPRTILLGCFL